MDLYEKEKDINVNFLPPRLRNFDDTKLKNVIINTQKCFYTLQIAETNKRIERYLLKDAFLYFYIFKFL